MNNKNIINRLKALKNDPEMTLSTSERSSMRSRLAECMDTPVTSGGVSRHVQGGVPSPYGLAFLRPLPVGLMGLAAIFLLSGGVAAAAEGSLPGDFLYPVKIHVTEAVVAYMAPSDEERALWEVARTERRIQEANMILARGETQPEVLAVVEKKIDVQLGRVLREIAKLSEQGDVVIATDVGTKLEARLDERVAELRALPVAESNIAGLDTIATSVTEKSRIVREERTENEASISSDPELENLALRRQKEAEANIAKLKDSLSNARELSDEDVVRLNAELIVAEELFDDASALLVAGAYADAATSFEEAGRLARKAAVSIGSLLNPLTDVIKVVE